MSPIMIIGGIALLALGATSATATQRRLEALGYGRWVPLALIPHGVLVGAGAALIRGWTLTTAMLVGAVVVPLVAIIGRLWEVRRARTRR